MAIGVIDPDGTLKLPQEFVEAAGLAGGACGSIDITSPTTLTVTVLDPASRVADAGESSSTTDREPIDYDALPILTFDELFERYRIEGPIDWPADREAMIEEWANEFAVEIRRDLLRE